MRAFTTFDRDGSGYIDKSEFLTLLHHLGHVGIPHDTAFVIFDMVDVNRNNQISRSEFRDCYMANF